MRILVDRVWPRGITKEKLKVGMWARDVAPSSELRKWFGHDPVRWQEFQDRYFGELDANPEAWRPILEAADQGVLTLVYGARDTEHNNAVALAKYLDIAGAQHRSAAKQKARKHEH
jgi:uncharacterized protein YeaO (DUF488 family)